MFDFRRWLVCCTGSLLLLLSLQASAAPDPRYPLTIQALQERYGDEMVAHQKYGAYARAALEEGYPNIAHLFRSLAASEAVHAANFARLLKQLGSEPKLPPIEFEISRTRKHLQLATEVEAAEIDTGYPAIIKAIEPEGHQAAIESITWAWQAEKQHRELIIKIRKAASRWFGLLVSHIEGDPSHFYVCQICGSTLTEQPQKQCPICNHPIHYEEVPGFPGRKKPEGSEGDGL